MYIYIYIHTQYINIQSSHKNAEVELSHITWKIYFAVNFLNFHYISPYNNPNFVHIIIIIIIIVSIVP